MAQWINAAHSKPPVSMSVLLLIVIYAEDSKHLSASMILSGFWSDEMDDDYEGWYLDKIDSYEKFIECSYIKVIAWTLLPESPYPEAFFIPKKLDE